SHPGRARRRRAPGRRPDGRGRRGMSLSVQVHGRIADLGQTAWDVCAAPTGDPFLSYAFLHACEASGSAVEGTGWGPRHLSLHDGETLLGVMPLYLKGHSQGEYVFDHGWAQAYEQAGGAYYPKLLSAVPFTPVTGPRLIAAPGADPARVREGLLGGALQLC